MQRICLVHYHEIGLKGHNRTSFEKRLLKNIEALLIEAPIAGIRRISGRLCVSFLSDASEQALLRAVDIIRCVPGVARVSSGYQCRRDLDSIHSAAIKVLSEAGEFQSFKVQARRNHTDFPITSMDMNRLIGAVLCDAFPEKTVKMKQPDVVVRVEVVQGGAYVCAQSVCGIGGLPVGTAGKVVCLLSSGFDSPVATWRMARRGAVCIGVHFSGRPQTSSTSEYLVDEIASVLERSGCIECVYIIPFGDYQREIAGSVPPSLRVIIYRRLMFRVAERIAHIEGAKALVTGESLGQVASQTLDNISVCGQGVSLPVLRPLIGTDKVEIIRMAEELKTFEISSQDAPDCCTLFMPRNPETHAKLSVVESAESKLPLKYWVDKIVLTAEKHLYSCPSYHPSCPR